MPLSIILIIMLLSQSMCLRTGMTPCYITLDTLILIRHFAERRGLQRNYRKKYRSGYYKAVWNRFFKTNKPIFKKKGYSFNHLIATDGIGVSLTFVKNGNVKENGKLRLDKGPKQQFHYIEELSQEQLDGLKKKPIVGADPGKYNILYMSDASVSNGKIKKLRYTAVQSKQEGGSSRRDVIMEYEKGRRKFADLTIQDYETFLSMCNSKTVDYERFKTYIHVKSMVSSMVGSFYEDEKWRKIKFRTYSNKQKSIDTFLTKVGTTFGKDAVIAYGDWSRKTQMKSSCLQWV